MSQITLTDEQSAVKDGIVSCLLKTLQLRDEAKGWMLGLPMYKTLGGLAGTGKTTLIKQIVAELKTVYDISCVICAFTGKAGDVLRRKGLDASTIHSTIYTPIVSKGVVVGYNKLSRDEICNDKKWVFIIDEASMVASDQFSDLLAVGVPILFVGDHGQLEPVGDDPKLMKNLDFQLTEIQRQAKESPIIQFAYEVRTNPVVPKVRRVEPFLTVLPSNLIRDEDLLWADQIIGVYNKQRHEINAKVRKLKDLPHFPVEGDRLICLENNQQLGVFNGQQFTIAACHPDGEMTLEFPGRHGSLVKRRIPVCLKFLGQDIPKNERLPKDQAVMDYAYCITAHKSQGSEYDKVLVIEAWIGGDWMDVPRWRYTSATRAAKELRYFVPTMR